MYEAMKNEVEDVSEAISDVKVMIQDSHQARGSGDQSWMVEWLHQVDNLVRLDSGWDWMHFFKMIADNIDDELKNTPVSTSISPTHCNIGGLDCQCVHGLVGASQTPRRVCPITRGKYPE